MERLRDITTQPPETVHEQNFQDTYGHTIEEALNRLKNPSNPSIPHSSWSLFKQVRVTVEFIDLKNMQTLLLHVKCA